MEDILAMSTNPYQLAAYVIVLTFTLYFILLAISTIYQKIVALYKKRQEQKRRNDRPWH
ncbi:MAG: hypothetical protein IPM37_15620 [Hahellaceae bacterium]|nr:hypothetical protein [Hahellaceae bacterium]